LISTGDLSIRKVSKAYLEYWGHWPMPLLGISKVAMLAMVNYCLLPSNFYYVRYWPESTIFKIDFWNIRLQLCHTYKLIFTRLSHSFTKSDNAVSPIK
jgi:hypothetical protein